MHSLGTQHGTQPGHDLIAGGLVEKQVRSHLAGSACNEQVLKARHALEFDEHGPQLQAARELHGRVAVGANGQHVAALSVTLQQAETPLVHFFDDRRHAAVVARVLVVPQNDVAALLRSVGDLGATIFALHAE